MTAYTFESILIRPEGVGTWTYQDIPPEVTAALGKRGQVKVRGTINGYPYRSSARPQGDGTHYLVVNREIRDVVGAAQGDTVRVVLEVDTEERSVEVPEDIRQALEAHPEAKEVFDSLPYSYQKEHLGYIEEAKKPATRHSRIEKTLGRLLQERNLKS